MIDRLRKGFSQRGGISIGCIILLVLLVAVGWHAWIFGKVYLDRYAFSEKIFNGTEGVFHQDREDVLDMVKEAADEYRIPLDPEKVRVEQTSREITIEVPYQVTVETPLIKRTLKFKVLVNRNFTR